MAGKGQAHMKPLSIAERDAIDAAYAQRQAVFDSAKGQVCAECSQALTVVSDPAASTGVKVVCPADHAHQGHRPLRRQKNMPWWVEQREADKERTKKEGEQP